MTDWYALDVLEEAWDNTRELLLPFDWKNWARLMVIVIFTGGGLGIPMTGLPEDSSYESNYSSTDNYDTNYTNLDNLSSPMTGMVTQTDLGGATALLAVGLVVLGIALGFYYLTSVFEFIFYQSLLDKDVKVRKNFWKHSDHGLNYLVFRLGVLTLMVLLLGIALVPVAVNPIFGALLFLLWILALIPVMIFLGLTNNFILIRVIESDRGIISSWKSFRKELEGQWNQVGFYIFIRFVLKMAVSALGLLWMVLTLVAVGIPTAILGYGLYTVAEILVVIPVSLGILVWIVAMLLYRVPAQTFLYHYSILVYRELTEHAGSEKIDA